MRELSYKLTQEDFASIRPVDVSCFELFKPFQYKRLDYPVFFHSIMELNCLGHFYWVIIRDCLVVIRVKRMYSNVSCIVYFSPISILNNVWIEQELLMALVIAGFSVRVTGSEAYSLELNLRKVNASVDPFGSEFIYSTRDTLDMHGQEYFKIRNRFNKFEKAGGIVEYGYTPDVTDFILSWAKMKKIHYGKYTDFLINHSDLVSCTRLYLGGTLRGFNAIEKVGDYYYSVVTVADYDSFDLLPAIHYHMVKKLSCDDTYLTTGAARSEGLASQKRRMRPCKEEPVYRIPAIGDRANAYSLVEPFI